MELISQVEAQSSVKSFSQAAVSLTPRLCESFDHFFLRSRASKAFELFNVTEKEASIKMVIQQFDPWSLSYKSVRQKMKCKDVPGNLHAQNTISFQ